MQKTLKTRSVNIKTVIKTMVMQNQTVMLNVLICQQNSKQSFYPKVGCLSTLAMNTIIGQHKEGGKVKHELRVTRSNRRFTSSNRRFMSSNPRVTSPNLRVTS